MNEAFLQQVRLLGGMISGNEKYIEVEDNLGTYLISMKNATVVYVRKSCSTCERNCPKKRDICLVLIGKGYSTLPLTQTEIEILSKVYMIKNGLLPPDVVKKISCQPIKPRPPFQETPIFLFHNIIFFFLHVFACKTGRPNPRKRSKEQYVFKILLLGDSDKSFFYKYVNNTFEPDYKSTIGVQFFTKVLRLPNSVIKLVMWDVMGQSKFTSYRHLYYKDSEGSIILFNETKPNYMESLTSWIEESLRHTGKNTKIALIGLISGEPSGINQEKIQALIRKYPNIVSYQESDQELNPAINDLFRTMSFLILNGIRRTY